jgi:hypothetical protein
MRPRFAFSEVVKELHRRIGTSAKEEYKRLERTSTEQARLALEQHIAVHRC